MYKEKTTRASGGLLPESVVKSAQTIAIETFGTTLSQMIVDYVIAIVERPADITFRYISKNRGEISVKPSQESRLDIK